MCVLLCVGVWLCMWGVEGGCREIQGSAVICNLSSSSETPCRPSLI